VEALQRMLHIQMYHTPIPGEYHSWWTNLYYVQTPVVQLQYPFLMVK
jgi:hypothetical protein